MYKISNLSFESTGHAKKTNRHFNRPCGTNQSFIHWTQTIVIDLEHYVAVNLNQHPTNQHFCCLLSFSILNGISLSSYLLTLFLSIHFSFRFLLICVFIYIWFVATEIIDKSSSTGSKVRFESNLEPI